MRGRWPEGWKAWDFNELNLKFKIKFTNINRWNTQAISSTSVWHVRNLKNLSLVVSGHKNCDWDPQRLYDELHSLCPIYYSAIWQKREWRIHFEIWITNSYMILSILFHRYLLENENISGCNFFLAPWLCQVLSFRCC